MRYLIATLVLVIVSNYVQANPTQGNRTERNERRPIVRVLTAPVALVKRVVTAPARQRQFKDSQSQRFDSKQITVTKSATSSFMYTPALPIK